MNKNIAKVFVGITTLFTLSLVACGPKPASVPTSKITSISLSDNSLSMFVGCEDVTLTVTAEPEDEPYTIEWSSSDSTVATVADGVVHAVGSGKADITAKVKNSEVSEKCAVTVAPEWFDYVKEGDVKLTLAYASRNFFTDGIEQVTLQTAIDGDTAHFKTGSNQTLKARFWGIDTPESTGKVQPWGYEASEFTSNLLKEANKNGTIVVSSPSETYGAPDPDSTGSRYVSLVWINLTVKNAPITDLYLVNLWVVQEGLSMVKNVSDIPAYEQTFRDAYEQSVTYLKNMWSGQRAPHYNYDGDYRDVSLLDIKREVELSIADSSHVNLYDNQKVRFTGVVSSYSDGTLYVQEFYPTDEDDPTVGEWAGINIFCGMQVIPTKFTKPNTYLQVYGLAKDSATFGFQITDTQGHWKAYGAGDHDCKVILSAEDNVEEHSLYTFHYTIEELNDVASSNNCESLFCSVSVEGILTCTRAFVSDDRAVTLYFSGTSWNVYIPYAYHGDQTDEMTKVIRWDEPEDFVGKTFRLDEGTYAWHRTQAGRVTYQVIPVSELTFLWVESH